MIQSKILADTDENTVFLYARPLGKVFDRCEVEMSGLKYELTLHVEFRTGYCKGFIPRTGDIRVIVTREFPVYDICVELHG
jgi:hypothetical protein